MTIFCKGHCIDPFRPGDKYERLLFVLAVVWWERCSLHMHERKSEEAERQALELLPRPCDRTRRAFRKIFHPDAKLFAIVTERIGS